MERETNKIDLSLLDRIDLVKEDDNTCWLEFYQKEHKDSIWVVIKNDDYEYLKQGFIKNNKISIS